MNRQQMDYIKKVKATMERIEEKKRKKKRKEMPLECTQIGLGVDSLFKTGNSRPLFGAGRGLPLH